jgi:hypothetical protein
MAKQDNGNVSESGRGSEVDPLSQSPLAIRRGTAGPMTSIRVRLQPELNELNYDANTSEGRRARRRLAMAATALTVRTPTNA